MNKQQLWSKFLDENYCEADRRDNRPCDRGFPCDDCHTDLAKSAFDHFQKRQMLKLVKFECVDCGGTGWARGTIICDKCSGLGTIPHVTMPIRIADLEVIQATIEQAVMELEDQKSLTSLQEQYLSDLVRIMDDLVLVIYTDKRDLDQEEIFKIRGGIEMESKEYTFTGQFWVKGDNGDHAYTKFLEFLRRHNAELETIGVTEWEVDLESIELVGPKWVNTYEVTREYGGPEEGGWWYDVFECIDSVQVPEELAKETQRAKEEEFSDRAYGNISSVLGGVRVDVYIEEQKAESETKERPHYE